MTWRVIWEVWIKLGLLYTSCWLSVSFPSHTFLSVWYTVYWSWETIPHTLCRCHSGLWHIGSHCFVIIINCNIISHLHHHLRKSKMTLFRRSLCLLFVMSLGFLELSSNYPLERLWPPLTQSSCLAITKTIWSEWTRAWWPHWDSLVLNALGCHSWGPARSLTILRTIWF